MESRTGAQRRDRLEVAPPYLKNFNVLHCALTRGVENITLSHVAKLGRKHARNQLCCGGHGCVSGDRVTQVAQVAQVASGCALCELLRSFVWVVDCKNRIGFLTAQMRTLPKNSRIGCSYFLRGMSTRVNTPALPFPRSAATLRPGVNGFLAASSTTIVTHYKKPHQIKLYYRYMIEKNSLFF